MNTLIMRELALLRNGGISGRGCCANILKWALLFAVVIPAITGCSSTLSLKPTVVYPPGLKQVKTPVGFFHSSEFRAYQHSADVYGNKHTFVFPIGAGSDALFKSIYPNVFQSVRALEARTAGGSATGKAAVVIEPHIEAFQFPLQSLKGPYWAEIIYRFTLYSLDGKELVSWTTKGWGESGDGSVYGEFGPIADATNKAMQSAALKFVRSFDHVPEVKRWATGMSTEGATAIAEKQVTGLAPQTGEGALEGSYEGIVTVRVKLNADPSMRTLHSKSALMRVGISAIELLVKNEGHHTLFLDPLNIVWAPSVEQEVFPLPASVISAALTTRYTRIGPISTGIGLTALPALFVSLANAAADAAERKEIASNLKVYSREELHEVVLRRAESVAGMVYFPAGLNDAVSGELRVPVIDVDKAIRYVVRFPVNIR